MVYGKIYGICALVAAPFTGRVKNRAIIAPKRAPTGLKTAHNANKTNSDLRMSALPPKADIRRRANITCALRLRSLLGKTQTSLRLKPEQVLIVLEMVTNSAVVPPDLLGQRSQILLTSRPGAAPCLPTVAPAGWTLESESNGKCRFINSSIKSPSSASECWLKIQNSEPRQ